MNERLFSMMKKDHLDVLVLCGADNVAYATGYDVPLPYGAPDAFGVCPLAYAVVDSAAKSAVLLVANFTPTGAGVFADEVQTFEVFDFFKPVEPQRALVTRMGEIFARHLRGAKRIGVEYGRMPALIYRELAAHDSGLQIIEAKGVLEEARMVKLPYEIERLRRAAEIEDAGQRCFAEYARDFNGETEMEIYAGVHRAMNEAAGHVVRISGDLATGARINCLGGVSGPAVRTVQPGDLGIFDMSIREQGYWCDCTNTVIFGARPNAEQRRLFSIVKEAYDTGFAKLYPGNTFQTVDSAVSNVFRKYGMEPVVYTGHQVGCNVNDVPRILCYEQAVIEPDMVVCMEPQNYTHDAGTSGVRLEKVIHITANGPVELNRFDWGMQI
jgi:Xaa-Pro aminopeptidase